MVGLRRIFSFGNRVASGARLGPSSGERTRWVGLDVGSHSIKVAEVERLAEGWRLVRALIEPLSSPPGNAASAVGVLGSAKEPPGSIGAAPLRPDDLLNRVRQVFRESGVGAVHLSIGGPGVALRRIRVPLMPEEELLEAAKWEVKEQVPFSVQQALLDAHKSGEVWERDVKKQELVVAACVRSALEERVREAESFGVSVESIVPTSWALWRCVRTLAPETAEGSVAVIELGHTQTDVMIMKEGEIRLSREIGLGEASFTEALVGVIASDEAEIVIDLPRAEALRRRYGLLPESEEGQTDEGIPFFQLTSLVRPVLENLLMELSRVLDFYKVQLEESGVARVLLCGAGVRSKRLQSFLSTRLGVKVELFDPLARMRGAAQGFLREGLALEEGSALAVAVGLAIDHGEGLNLAPSKRGEGKTAGSALQLGGKVRCGGALGAALGLALFLQLIGGWYSWRLWGLEKRWSSLEPLYVQGLQVMAEHRRLADRIEAIERFVARQPIWEGVFKELSMIVPAAIELDEFAIWREAGASEGSLRFRLKGHAVSDTGSTASGVVALMDHLAQSSFFAEPKLSGAEMRSAHSEETHFEIGGWLK